MEKYLCYSIKYFFWKFRHWWQIYQQIDEGRKWSKNLMKYFCSQNILIQWSLVCYETVEWMMMKERRLIIYFNEIFFMNPCSSNVLMASVFVAAVMVTPSLSWRAPLMVLMMVTPGLPSAGGLWTGLTQPRPWPTSSCPPPAASTTVTSSPSVSTMDTGNWSMSEVYSLKIINFK